MEINGLDFANICGVSRQCIHGLWKKGKLIKSEAGKFNIHEPVNNQYLLDHNKSVLDAEKYINQKPKRLEVPSSGGKSPVQRRKSSDDTKKLIYAVKSVIVSRYGEAESKIVLNAIFQEVKNLELT